MYIEFISCMFCVKYENIVIISMNFYLKYYKNTIYENTYYLKQYILDQLSDLWCQETKRFLRIFWENLNMSKLRYLQVCCTWKINLNFQTDFRIRLQNNL